MIRFIEHLATIYMLQIYNVPMAGKCQALKLSKRSKFFFTFSPNICRFYQGTLFKYYSRTFEEVVYQALKESINSTLAQWLITLPEKEIPYALIRDKWHQYLDRNMKSGRRYLMPSSILARSSYGYLLAHWYRIVSKKMIKDGSGTDQYGH